MLQSRQLPWEKPPRAKGAWLRDHTRFITETLRYFAFNVLNTLFVITLMSLAIALPSGLWMISGYLDRGSWVWPNQDGFNIYFTESASLQNIQTFEADLRNHDWVSSTTLITKEEGLNEYLEAADLATFMEDIDENPLPHTLTVHVVRLIETWQVEDLVAVIQSKPIVANVSYDTNIILRFGAINTVVDRILGVLSVTFCVFATFVSASGVRNSIHNQLHEIRILHVLGAPKRILRGSFLWCGAIYGILSGYFASVLLSLVIILVSDPLRALAQSYGITQEVLSINWTFLLSLVLVGLVLGLIGAYYTTFKHIYRVTSDWSL